MTINTDVKVTTRSRVQRTIETCFEEEDTVSMYAAANRLLARTGSVLRFSVDAAVEESIVIFERDNSLTHWGIFINDQANVLQTWTEALDNLDFHGSWIMPGPGVLQLVTVEERTTVKGEQDAEA